MDDKVLFPQQKFGVSKLREAGVVSIKDESYDMGHSSHPDEMQALADFIDQSLFGSGTDGDAEL